jgi:hypothetical protein
MMSVGRLKMLSKQLWWHPQSAIGFDFQTNLNKLYFELGHFHRKEGPYDNKQIWIDMASCTCGITNILLDSNTCPLGTPHAVLPLNFWELVWQKGAKGCEAYYW